MEFKGTKGKWELTSNKRGVEVNMKSRTYKSICSSTGNTKWQYDMLLISKAPEMLEMIKKLIEYIPNGTIAAADMYYEAYKLIKKATEL